MKHEHIEGSKRRRFQRGSLVAASMAAAAIFGFGACSSGEGAPPVVGGGTLEDDTQLAPEGAEPDDHCVVSDEFASCFESCQNAAVGPANLYIMFDSSQSMEEASKWANASAALKAFFADPGSAGLGVALRFFPDSGCDEESCSVSACSDPEVALGTLAPESTDPQEDALIAAIDDQRPFGGTPMRPALEGGIQWAEAQLAEETVQRPVIVLVTDGAPFGCYYDAEDVNADVAALAAQAAKAYSEHGILTYVVGLEGSWEWIVDEIASSGGTGKALLVSNESTYDELFAALQAIKESHVDCEVNIPADADISELDPGKVNVTYTPGDGSTPTTLDQVPDADSCTDAGGWYYDHPEAPTKILLCPTACSEIQSDKAARLDVLIGCATQVVK
jgi:hypothetical protein